MIGKAGLEAHGAAMEDGLVAKRREGAVTMDDVDALADDDGAEDGKETVDCGEGGLDIHDGQRDVVDFKAISHVTDARTVAVGVSDYDYLEREALLTCSQRRRRRTFL